MRLIAPRNAGPAAVNKYLLPHEHQVITVRKHPAVLIGPIAMTQTSEMPIERVFP